MPTVKSDRCQWHCPVFADAALGMRSSAHGCLPPRVTYGRFPESSGGCRASMPQRSPSATYPSPRATHRSSCPDRTPSSQGSLVRPSRGSGYGSGRPAYGWTRGGLLSARGGNRRGRASPSSAPYFYGSLIMAIICFDISHNHL